MLTFNWCFQSKSRCPNCHPDSSTGFLQFPNDWIFRSIPSSKMWCRLWRNTGCTTSSSHIIPFSSLTILAQMACRSNSWPPCFSTCFLPLMCTRWVPLFQPATLWLTQDLKPRWHDDSIVFWGDPWRFVKSKRFLNFKSCVEWKFIGLTLFLARKIRVFLFFRWTSTTSRGVCCWITTQRPRKLSFDISKFGNGKKSFCVFVSGALFFDHNSLAALHRLSLNHSLAISGVYMHLQMLAHPPFSA